MKDLSFDLLQKEIDYASYNRDFQGAFDVYNIVKPWIEKSNLKRNNHLAYSKYVDYLNKLKFLSLNFFDDLSDYIDLLKNHFHLIFDIPNFDIWEKLEIYLISISDINIRADNKAKLKEALEKSNDDLINPLNYKEGCTLIKVSDWIKSFVANIGLDFFDKVKKMEYLSSNKYFKALKEFDQEKVKVLLDTYEKLMIPSNTKEGYENTVIFDFNGKKMIFNHGEMEAVSNIKIFGEHDGLNPELTELEEALKTYSPNSLEYRAIQQEIDRLSKK